MGARHVGELHRPHHADAEGRHPLARRAHVGNLENGHITALTAAPLQIAGSSGARLSGRDDFYECVSDGKDRVRQAEFANTRVVEGRGPAKGLLELAGHLVAVLSDQCHLSQTGSPQHISAH